MVTLQDISIQLMKPAKDLADWKFPLSQILEEYYALLEEPCNINFGEAALVLQNSTNAYVRRIEQLFNETEVLKQTFFNYEEDEIKKSMCKEKRSFKKSYINFDNFVIIDLEKDVGKNIDKKNQLQGHKKIKLLSHRFTQLESNTTQLCIPIQVYDVVGEVVGKKYDFRCNQAVNTTGMLVDELTFRDFTHVLSSHVQKGRNSLSLYSEPKTPGTGTSGYHSAASPNESITSVHEDCENEQNFALQVDNISSINESEIREKEHTLNKDNGVSFANTGISNSIILQQNLFDKHCILSDKPQSTSNKHCTTLNDTNQIRQKYENNNLEQIECIEQVDCNKQFSYVTGKDQIVQLNKSNNVQGKEGLLSKRKKGNQATKMSVCSVGDINEFDWKPMPLIQGMKNAFSDNTSVLKLPEYISLLDTSSESRKRKLTSRIHKPECLTKFILRETELCVKKDIISRTEPKFKRLQKQELEAFMKNFDQCFHGTEKENDNSPYTAVTNFTISLLRFCSSQNQNNFMEYNVEETRSRSSSTTSTKSQSATCQNSHNMAENSTNLHNSWCESTVSEINLSYSSPDYQTLIEDKMKEIFAESDVATELDQTVAKWHASLQPKLLEAEIRPAFRIRDYASHIIGTLQELDKKIINFDNVVRDKPACEVARYFLASLQLANTYNIEIKTENSGKGIEIELLNAEKHYEQD